MRTKTPGNGSEARAVTVIERRSGLARLNITDVWTSRELIQLFVWRDLKVRYKQTAIGAAWAVLQPLLLMALFAVVFGRLVKISVGSVPRPLFYYSALVPWTYVSSALTNATTSVVSSQALITKVYFPRVVLPVAAVVPPIIDLAISLALLVVMVFVFGFIPGIGLAFVPLFVALAVATALGAGLWLSALNARYRDVQWGIAFFVQFWFFASPVFYPSFLVPRAWRPIWSLNPMVGVIEGFRWATLRQQPPSGSIAYSVVLVAVLLITGLWYFRSHENSLVDVV